MTQVECARHGYQRRVTLPLSLATALYRGESIGLKIENRSIGVYLLESPCGRFRLQPGGARRCKPKACKTVASECGDQLRSSDRVKPKVRLCEPWVMVRWIVEPRSGDREFVNRSRLITSDHCRPFGARFLGVVNPRLAKPRLGLNSDRRYAAGWRFTPSVE
jgi:hypothetical protein